MRRRAIVASAPALGALAGACGGTQAAPSNAAPGPGGTAAPRPAGTGTTGGTPVVTPAPTARFATVELEKGGTFTIELLPQLAPRWVANFVQKANAGFYNGLTFHRVEDWVVQGGDPTGTGAGGSSSIATEPTAARPFALGSVGVARGQDPRVSNDAQFFVVTKPADWLNNLYTLFGQVTEGMDTVLKIQRGDKMRRITTRTS